MSWPGNNRFQKSLCALCAGLVLTSIGQASYAIGGLGNGLGSGPLNTVTGTVNNVLGGTTAGIGGTLGGAVNSVTGAVGGVTGGITGAAGGVLNGASGIVPGGTSGIGGAVSGAVTGAAGSLHGATGAPGGVTLSRFSDIIDVNGQGLDPNASKKIFEQAVNHRIRQAQGVSIGPDGSIIIGAPETAPEPETGSGQTASLNASLNASGNADQGTSGQSAVREKKDSANDEYQGLPPQVIAKIDQAKLEAARKIADELGRSADKARISPTEATVIMPASMLAPH